MNRNTILIRVLTLCTGALMLWTCGKQAEQKSFITMMVGKVEIVRAGASTEAVLRQEILENDRIVTSEGAFAVIQLGNDKLVRVQESTSVNIRTFKDPANAEYFVEKGKVLSKVQKLSSGQSFKIKTPTMVASVRGTEFSVQYDSGRSVIAVKEGAVGMADNSNKDLGTVAAGNMALAEEKVEVKPIEKIELLDLEKISVTPIVVNIESATDEQVKAAVQPALEKDSEISVEIKKEKEKEEETAPMSLGEIKAKYGRIDEVRLYSGRVIEGAILERGSTYRMITPSGPVNIPAKQVRGTAVK